MYEVILKNGEESEKLHEMTSGSDRKVAACQFSRGVNMISTAQIVIYPQNPANTDIYEMTSTIEIVNKKTGNTEFEGRVLKVPAFGMDSKGVVTKEITCESFMGYLYDTVQRYRVFSNTSPTLLLQAILSEHNAQVPDEKKIYLGACDVTGTIASATLEYEQTFKSIKRLLLDEFGGELWMNRRDNQGRLLLDYLVTPETPVLSDTTIELAKNIVSLNVETDATHIITRLFPYGTKGENTDERLTIENAIVDGERWGKTYIDDANAISQYGVICGVMTYDDIDDATTLYSTALAYMQANNRIRKGYRAQVLDLSTIGIDPDALEVGKAYRFKNRLIDLDDDLRLVKLTIDIYKPYMPVVEIGDKSQKITSAASRAVNFIEYELPKMETSILDAAKDTATAMIQNATNGYVVFHDSNDDGIPDEILIMDATTTAAATKVWRWNSAGLGYSSTGYNGTYGLAMTMNGAIVADFITMGVLRSLQIINGSNGQFSVDISGNCVANAFTSNNATITGGSIEISASAGHSIQIYAGEIRFKDTAGNAVLRMLGDGNIYVWDGSNWQHVNMLDLQYITGLRSSVIQLQNNYTSLEARVSALEGN